MYCVNCGKELDESVAKCPYYGYELVTKCPFCGHEISYERRSEKQSDWFVEEYDSISISFNEDPDGSVIPESDGTGEAAPEEAVNIVIDKVTAFFPESIQMSMKSKISSITEKAKQLEKKLRSSVKS